MGNIRKLSFDLFLKVLLFVLVNSFFVSAFTQSAKELEKRKLDNIAKLNYSRELLEKTADSKTATVSQLFMIEQNIEIRTELIGNISSEIEYLKNDIVDNSEEILKIEKRISELKKEYAKLVVAAGRNLDKDLSLTYIFSSEDFNQAYQRLKYFRYLVKYREKVVEEMKQKQNDLLSENQKLLINKHNNEKLLNERKNELTQLDKDKKSKVQYISSLKKRESELKEEIKNREKIQNEIEIQIRKAIEEETAKAKRNNRLNVLTPEEKLISDEFYKNIGKLPWPTEKGLITGKFGEQNHPVLKGIKIKSNGIDISTDRGSEIRTVFGGEVTKVIAILGANYSVIIKHGDYWTVYQNLVDVKVKTGDKVKVKQTLGTVFTDQENASKVHFEVWKDKDPQNPEIWLSK
jgi:murein hydrolase activator